MKTILFLTGLTFVSFLTLPGSSSAALNGAEGGSAVPELSVISKEMPVGSFEIAEDKPKEPKPEDEKEEELGEDDC
jgi:hypothetical protein